MQSLLKLPRRIYLLAVSLVSLALGAASFSAVAAAVTERLIGTETEVPLIFVAGIIVQIPIWAIHWTLAQRDATRSLAERGSVLRRIYLYLVMTAGLALGGAGTSAGLSQLAGTGTRDEIIESAIRGVIGLALWAYHRRIVVFDRTVCSEAGLASTVRRIASYGPAAVATVFALAGVTELATSLARRITPTDISEMIVQSPAWAIGAVIVCTAIWVTHHRGASAFAGGILSWPPIAGPSEDDRATIPVAYRFVVLTISIVSTMYGAAQFIHWMLGFMAGSEVPDHPGNSALDGLVEGCIYGSAWWLYRLSAIEARFTTQDGAPRGLVILYRCVATVIGLCTWVLGLALVLTNAITLGMAPSLHGDLQDAWRREVALVLVGVPLWLAYWRAPGHPRLDIGETGSRSRRGALYLILLACALALLATGVAVTYTALEALVGREVHELPWWAMVSTVLSISIGAYHFSVLRADTQRLSQHILETRGEVNQLPCKTLDDDPTSKEWALIRGGPTGTSVRWFGTHSDARAAMAQTVGEADGQASWVRMVRTVPTTPDDGGDQPA
ncbi:MAG: hypothetical protein EXR45_00020 [Chloroflexi bacterium]|nr:hypothetical protein [Chloroflexota bacterium]